MEEDVVTFDPDSQVAFLSNESMYELQDAKATIEPPPASSFDDADVHVHEMVTAQTLAPPLLDTSESSDIVAKGNKSRL